MLNFFTVKHTHSHYHSGKDPEETEFCAGKSTKLYIKEVLKYLWKPLILLFISREYHVGKSIHAI